MKRNLIAAVLCALAAGLWSAAFAQRLPETAEAADRPSALLIPYIPRPGQANQGFVSFENYGQDETSVSLELYDEHGTEVATVLVALPSRVTRWVNSAELERGNASKGVSVTLHETARGPSLWARVQPDSEHVRIFAYLRSSAGFVTGMSRTATNLRRSDGRRVAFLPFFNPGSNTIIQSELRILNPTSRPRTVFVDASGSNGSLAEARPQCDIPTYGASRCVTD